MAEGITRLDHLVNYIDKTSKKPIRKIFDWTVDGYLPKDKQEEIKENAYNELLYFYLTDLMEGCQMSVQIEGFNDELEHLKDVIGFNTSSTVVMKLAEKMQTVLIHTESRLKNEPMKYDNLKRFVFMGMSYHDERYIPMLAEQLIKEGINEDKLISKINQIVMKNEIKILKLSD